MPPPPYVRLHRNPPDAVSFAGQLTGVEGYVEGAAMGHIASADSTQAALVELEEFVSGRRPILHDSPSRPSPRPTSATSLARAPGSRSRCSGTSAANAAFTVP